MRRALTRHAPLMSCLGGLMFVFCLRPSPVHAADLELRGSDPKSIALTRTMSELMAQVPVTLHSGIAVRLGIEAVDCGAGSGVAVYCVTSGYAPDRTGTRAHGLGPLNVSVVHSGSRTVHVDDGLVEDGGTMHGTPRTCLFVKEVATATRGDFEVVVFSSAGDLIATAPLSV